MKNILIFGFTVLATILVGCNKNKDNIIAQMNREDQNMIYPTEHKYIKVDGINIFYREAGSIENPTILLLHGYPTSSQMFKNLIRKLSDQFHLIAPDFPGFGKSDQPDIKDYEYSFENYANTIKAFLKAKAINRYSIYLMDYGAPVGFIIANDSPEKVDALIVQNGNVYEEGLGKVFEKAKKLWKEPTEENRHAIYDVRSNMDVVIWEYTHGTRNKKDIDPDNWTNDFYHLLRPGNFEIQVKLVEDYGNNVLKYPMWQQYLKDNQPPTLIVWGGNDEVFPPTGAYPYQKDLKNIEFHLLNTGHFALEEDGDLIANYIREFLNKNIVNK